MDPMDFMETNDQIKVMTMSAIAQKTTELRAEQGSL